MWTCRLFTRIPSVDHIPDFSDPARRLELSDELIGFPLSIIVHLRRAYTLPQQLSEPFNPP